MTCKSNSCIRFTDRSKFGILKEMFFITFGKQYKLIITSISNAARGSGNVVEHPLPNPSSSRSAITKMMGAQSNYNYTSYIHKKKTNKHCSMFRRNFTKKSHITCFYKKIMVILIKMSYFRLIKKISMTYILQLSKLRFTTVKVPIY